MGFFSFIVRSPWSENQSPASALEIVLYYVSDNFFSSLFSVLSFWEPTNQMLSLLAWCSKFLTISLIFPLSLGRLGVVYTLRNFLNFIFVCLSIF